MISVQDRDFTLLCCDVLEGLASLPDESVHCVVTSPPYWGLRDYSTPGQLGLEPTPDEYVARMVEVFREVRRVMRSDATLWCNLGDSFGPGKQMAGIPWRVAFALQADGWILRSDIIWSKPNPMPESVTDRPTKAHEYVFLLTKGPRYFFDQEAVREGNGRQLKGAFRVGGSYTSGQSFDNSARVTPTDSRTLDDPAGRNVRSVWDIPTQPYPEAHFATYPEELVRRCILAGTSERGCCPECGKPWERETEVSYSPHWKGGYIGVKGTDDPHVAGGVSSGYQADGERLPRMQRTTATLGWRPGCDCDKTGPADFAPDPPDSGVVGGASTIPCTVLDPFLGSGTTAYVARKHGRRSIGIELNPAYAELAARRMQQQSLFA